MCLVCSGCGERGERVDKHRIPVVTRLKSRELNGSTFVRIWAQVWAHQEIQLDMSYRVSGHRLTAVLTTCSLHSPFPRSESSTFQNTAVRKLLFYHNKRLLYFDHLQLLLFFHPISKSLNQKDITVVVKQALNIKFKHFSEVQNTVKSKHFQGFQVPVGTIKVTIKVTLIASDSEQSDAISEHQTPH